MKLSRRGILSGLLVAGAMHPAEAPAAEIKPTLIKGQIISRYSSRIEPVDYRFANSPMHMVAVTEYMIFDGEKFIPLDSVAGQDIVRALGE